MKTQRVTLALTALNVLILVLGVTRGGPVGAQSDPSIIRAQSFELVDVDGDLRARLGIEENGEVVFRMVDQTGTIRMKLGAGNDGSGLVLLNDETEPGVHLLAKDTGSTVTLTGKDGKELVLTP